MNEQSGNEQSGFQVQGTAAENYERFVGVFMTPWAERLVEVAELAAGDTVLDLACGTGFVARAAADVVGPGGRVVGVDVNPLMLDVARRVGGFDVIEAPADNTGLEQASVDVVLCQQGLQYFPDPGAALAEVARCLEPRGRAHFAVWAPLADNPLIAGQIDALAPHLDPEAVEAFRKTNIDSLGGADGVEKLLTGAGLAEVSVNVHRLEVTLPPMAEYFPNLISATPWAPIFADLAPTERSAVIERMESAVTVQHDPPATLTRMTAVIATGMAK